MNENACIQVLVEAVLIDISRGLKEDDIIKALANVVDGELVARVRDRLQDADYQSRNGISYACFPELGRN